MKESADSSESPHFRRGPRGHLLLPGGYGRSTFSMGAALPFAVRGDGYRVWDDVGRELIDLNNNFTVLVHGHAHPQVTEAAQKALRSGSCFGLPTTYEWEHAERLLTRLPALDQVRYTNSGTEAVMTALRLARAATNRDRIILVRNAYHGTSDPALATGDDRYRRGVPAGVVADIDVIGINDCDALQAAVESAPDEYAALVLDLLPNRSGLVPLDPQFVELARSLADRRGIVLIFDEVISFRLGVSGLAGQYGVVPDLMTLGKVIGGGLPIGAIVGRAAVMEELDPTQAGGLEHGGTFSANPVSMAAGIAALDLLTADEIARLNGLGDELRTRLNSRLAQCGWEMRGSGSLMRPFPHGDAYVPQQLQRALWWSAYRHGLLLSQYNVGTLSTPMHPEVIDDVADRWEASVTTAVASLT